MGTTEPIRDKETLRRFRNYYRDEEPNKRNWLLIVAGLNTALRISDILSLKWSDVYDFKRKRIRDRIRLRELKTGKSQNIVINKSLKEAIRTILKDISISEPDRFIFTGYGDRPMNRSTAYRIVRRVATALDLPGSISCHSLRKTFGYHAWKQGAQPALLMDIYNHSSFRITRRYLGIDQDDKDSLFYRNNL